MYSLPSKLARGALDAAPDAMLIIDGDGVIRFANRQVSAVFGHTHDQLLGKTVEHLMPERFRGRHPGLREAYTRNAVVRPMGAGLNLYALRADGSEFPVEISLSPIDDDGSALFAIAIRDVTDRKRVEAELSAQLEDMNRLHRMSTGLIAANGAAAMLEEILGATIDLQRADFGIIRLRDPESGLLRIVAHCGFSPAFLQHFAVVWANEPSSCGRALRAGARVIIEDVDADPDYRACLPMAQREGYRTVQSTPMLARDGTTMGMLSTYFRVPHRPSDRELQLTDLYMGLAAGQIARAQGEDAVRAARDVADRANLAKSRFLATASHDLRQPLQALSLLHGSLRRMAVPGAVSEVLDQQEQAISGMSRLLNALLDISKLESGAIKPDPTDFTVAALFEEMRQEFAALASSKGLNLEVEPCAEFAHSDLSLVGQVLRNLVANAIKYTRTGWVALRCLHDQPACVRIEVLDTGVGIPAEQLRFIYDEFYQVGVHANTTREGYGLGLSIVQRIVALLDLRLDVQSEVGKGSVFSLTLPLGDARAVPVARPRLESPRPTRRLQGRVLLVEDDPAVRAATRLLLKSEGFQVSAVATMAEALEQAKSGPAIDLVVTDYHLAGGETGTQVISALRTALGRTPRAVLLTGDTSSAVREMPGDALLRIASKPIDAEELLAMLRELLES
jgi:two-component system, sensor histidine kinase